VIEGSTIDVLGLVTGMTIDETKAAMALGFPNSVFHDNEQSFQARMRGVTIKAEPFVSTVEVEGINETMKAQFTGGASGNQSFAIARSVNYPDVLAAPTPATIVAALTEKYGAPSANDETTYFWTFAAGQQVPCVISYYGDTDCPRYVNDYSPHSLGDYANSTSAYDYVIMAEITTNYKDTSKVRELPVSAGDIALRREAAQADSSSIMAELERVHSASSQEVTAPKL